MLSPAVLKGSQTLKSTKNRLGLLTTLLVCQLCLGKSSKVMVKTQFCLKPDWNFLMKPTSATLSFVVRLIKVKSIEQFVSASQYQNNSTKCDRWNVRNKNAMGRNLLCSYVLNKSLHMYSEQNWTVTEYFCIIRLNWYTCHLLFPVSKHLNVT